MSYDPLGGAKDMVERVAIAISLVDDCQPGRGSAVYYRELARSAIAAMREPTDAMRQAAYAACDENGHVLIASGYRAMINAALCNPEQG